MPVKFLHTADWQIGMKALQAGEKAKDIRAQRFETASRVVELARREGADFILIAGDLFDGHDVDDVDVKRIVNILNEVAPTPVYVLPGNHDPLVPGGVWDRSSWNRHGEHVRVLAESTESPVRDEVALYPCPLRQKQSTQDPTAWIPQRAPDDDRIRIGIAHGALNILPDSAANFPIAPDRTDEAVIDYLALGDWHGYMEHGRAVYSGTIEPTSFGEADPGNVALVTIEAPRAVPRIEKHRVASLTWKTFEPEIHDGSDVDAFERDVRTAEDLGSLVLRVRPTFPDPVDQDTFDALDTLRRMIEQEVFVLRWDESAQPPLSPDVDLEIPDGVLRRIDEDLAAILEGQIPNGPGQAFASQDPDAVALARRMLHRFAREVGP